MIESFTTQFSDESKVWRYLSFPGFVNALQSRAFHFASVEALRKSDPFEGKKPANVSARVWVGGQERLAHLDASNAERLNRRMFVNCWHVAEWESAAMWKLYSEGSGKAGIAIQSDRALNMKKSSGS